ncbi:MAG: hypothetical protein U0931_29715 [Vulcanimicrobiota bacterium]
MFRRMPTEPDQESLFRLVRIENLSTGSSYQLDSKRALPASCVNQGDFVRLECPQGYIAGCWEDGQLSKITSWLWNSIRCCSGLRRSLEGQLRSLLPARSRKTRNQPPARLALAPRFPFRKGSASTSLKPTQTRFPRPHRRSL